MKQDFIDELFADIPEGVAKFLTTPFGVIDEIEIPTDEKSAKIACGKLAAHLNNAFLRPFSGFTPAEALMRIGSKNAVQVSAMLSGLEVIAGAGGKLTPIAPTDGGVYENNFEIQAKGNGLIGVGLKIGEDLIALSEQDGIWKGKPMTPFASGVYSGKFVGTFEDGSDTTVSVAFETTGNLKIVSTFPKKETSYLPQEVTRIEIELNADGAAENESLTADVFGKAFTLVKTGTTYMAEIGSIAVDWVKLNQMSVKNAAGEIIDTLTFIINPPEAE